MGAAAPATRNLAPSVRHSMIRPCLVLEGGRLPAPTRDVEGVSETVLGGIAVCMRTFYECERRTRSVRYSTNSAQIQDRSFFVKTHQDLKRVGRQDADGASEPSCDEVIDKSGFSSCSLSSVGQVIGSSVVDIAHVPALIDGSRKDGANGHKGKNSDFSPLALADICHTFN